MPLSLWVARVPVACPLNSVSGPYGPFSEIVEKIEGPLPSLPNLRFFLPRPAAAEEEPLPEPLSLLFQRVSMFRMRLSVSNVGRSA